jgi:protein-tyrosine kinase
LSLVEKALSKMKQAERAAFTGQKSHPATFRSAVPEPTDRRLLQLDMVALRAAGYLPPEPQDRELMEQYRHIKGPIVERALGRSSERFERAAVLMVTSALPQEGRTFTAINLCRSLALENDASVLLVDADVANPQASRLLGIENEPGLMDALLDPSCDVESLTMGTSIAGMEVLAAGHYTDVATELFGSRRMNDVIERLASAVRNRIIVFDSPPLLITHEGQALGSACGQVVLVVHAYVTRQEAVLDALEAIPERRSVGLVLNQSEHVARLGHGHYHRGSEQGRDRRERAAEKSA